MVNNNNKCKLSIIIPVYGSELILEELVSQVHKVLCELDNIKENYEIIFVCDNSPDGSWRVIQTLREKRPQVRGILLRMNAGQHNALMAGLSKARGEIIITMDDDLQHSPADIPKLLLKIEQGFDVVYAHFSSRNHPLWKVAGSRLNNLVAGYLLQKPNNQYLSPFRAMRYAICKDLLLYKGPYVYVDGLILSVTQNISSVVVRHQDRYAGKSGYGLRKLVSLWLKMATSSSIVPLRLTSIVGFIFSLIGFLLAILFIIQKLTLNTMPTGWSSLIVTMLIIGGVQLLALGMLGEYLGRVLLTINARPQYTIAETIGLASSDNKNLDLEN